MNKPAGRNNTIDLLRFFAACAVVFFHQQAYIEYKDNWYRNICGMLWLGVPAFFVISGYCILIAVKHTRSPNEFITRRFFRIFPAYWFSVVLILAIIAGKLLINHINDVAALPKTPLHAMAIITLFTSPVTHFKTINWVYWSLSCEVCFYIVVYLVLFLKPKYRLAAFVFITAVTLVAPPQYIPAFFLKNWPSFALGLGGHYLLHNAQGNKILVILLLLLCLGAIWHAGDINWLIVCILTCLAIIANSIRPLPDNFFSRLGDLSYSIYLIHVPICVYMLGRLKTVQIQNNVALNIAFDCITLSITIASAALIFKYIEKPAINFGKKLLLKPAPDNANNTVIDGVK
ncbi:acyltransferase family protein [Mucilaginibacter pedocola]|uniref:Acyltransferase 3 domain-containing protein n=1 Tax=Mucilaginibacter pedocola TaxID=1792845 RepID=A0A1S9PAP4_9SPHI|nr:acyltransferase [Mucilaginibacter pedocola]OOQ57658.1 hypothetical protein BC343_12720 [Mucilaginibacter pedocola]